MKEIPMLFSTAMVQAELTGRKTKTRRTKGLEEYNKTPDEFKIVRRDVPSGFQVFKRGNTAGVEHFKTYWDDVECPYGKPGDLLWVRENFKVQEVQKYFDTEWRNNVCIDFSASEGTLNCRHWFKVDEKNRPQVIRRRHPEKIFTSPGIHLPKVCARIWLEVTDIRVERLQDISEEDAIAEGILWHEDHPTYRRYKDYISDASGYGHPDHDYPTVSTAKESFKTLWQLINGPESWDANPWVWVISFKVLSTTGKPELITASATP